MPDRHIGPFDMDELHAAVDRLAAGLPAPVSGDPELQELIDIAARLRHELPPDIPDPAFRESLKYQLLEPYVPGIAVHPHRHRRVTQRATRFPYVAATGAIAAVIVAVVVVGAFAVSGNRSGDDSVGVAGVTSGVTETARVSTLSAFASPTDSPGTVESEPPGGFGRTSLDTATPNDTNTPPPGSSPDASPTVASSPTPVATLIATTQPTPEPTSDRQLAMVLPPVDSTTVESGPVPAAGDGAGGATTTMTFELATELPSLASSAPAYLLTPPDDDPVALVSAIARELGLEGDVQMSDDGGKMAYHIGTDSGATFLWMPETGAFSYSSPDDGSQADMTSDDVVASCKGWLDAVGYPVERLTGTMDAYPVDNTSWLVETAMDSMPQPGYGHPLGVRMIVSSDGKVVDAKGYWLTTKSMSEVPLISASEAWSELISHQGYWFGAGGAFAEGGEFRVEAIELSYVLTHSPDGLVLQPVIAMRGEFSHADGISSSGVTVFIRAARAQARYSGP